MQWSLLDREGYSDVPLFASQRPLFSISTPLTTCSMLSDSTVGFSQLTSPVFHSTTVAFFHTSLTDLRFHDQLPCFQFVTLVKSSKVCVSDWYLYRAFVRTSYYVMLYRMDYFLWNRNSLMSCRKIPCRLSRCDRNSSSPPVLPYCKTFSCTHYQFF